MRLRKLWKNIPLAFKGSDYMTSDRFQQAFDDLIEYLDSIDLEPWLERYKGYPVWDLMKVLDINYPYQNEYFDSLFDELNEDDFIQYLKSRYDTKFKEETIIIFKLT